MNVRYEPLLLKKFIYLVVWIDFNPCLVLSSLRTRVNDIAHPFPVPTPLSLHTANNSESKCKSEGFLLGRTIRSINLVILHTPWPRKEKTRESRVSPLDLRCLDDLCHQLNVKLLLTPLWWYWSLFHWLHFF